MKRRDYEHLALDDGSSAFALSMASGVFVRCTAEDLTNMGIALQAWHSIRIEESIDTHPDKSLSKLHI